MKNESYDLNSNYAVVVHNRSFRLAFGCESLEEAESLTKKFANSGLIRCRIEKLNRIEAVSSVTLPPATSAD